MSGPRRFNDRAGWLLTWATFLATLQLLCLWAAPFSKEIPFQQPDGTAIRLWGQGDEFYAVFETLDGYTVVFDEGLRAYCYARLSDDERELLSTGVQVHLGNAQSLGLEPHLRIRPEAVAEQAAARHARWNEGMRISERWQARKQALAMAADGGAAFSPPGGSTLGLKVGLTLLIDFDDDVATVPQAEIINFCNGDNYSGYGNNGSVKAYFAYNSNGKLTYTNVVTLYIRAPKPKTTYNDTTKDAGQQGRLLIKDALEVLKALPNYDSEILPAFAALSTDSQNRVLACNVFYAGDNGGRWSYGLWPHSWVLASPIELSPGGKRVYFYQITNIGDKLSIGTFVHENGHMLCDYPDLYDYTGRSAGVGDWCLMAGGSWGGSSSNPGNNPAQICAYLKRASGWATTIDLDLASSLVATVHSQPGSNFNTFYRFAKPGTAREYFLIEARYKTNHDNSLPGSGVAVWHIDELGDNSTVNLNPNTTHNNYEATLVQADNQWHLEKNRNSGDSKDLYYQGNTAAGYSNLLSDTSSPHAHWWSGQPSGLVLRDFSALGLSMTFVVGTNDPAPIIVKHPSTLTVVPGQTATFTAAASGFSPLYYQWRKDGAAIAGATQSAYLIVNVQPADVAEYSVTVTNAYGTVTSASASLVVIPTVPLPYALNNSNQTWITDAEVPWYGQTNFSYDGLASARSYFIGHDQSTSLRTTVTGPGTLEFWWRVSSQTNADILSFRLDAEEIARISGEKGWEQKSLYLPAGSLDLEWLYRKDASGSAGQDQGWVDQVRYTAGATLPFITEQPASQSSVGGAAVTFKVAALGTPTLAYQWFFNGAPIAGATASSFTLASPGVANGGYYSVRVSNPYGAILSSNALLGVVPMAIAGDNSFGQISVVAAATNPVAVAAGSWHSLALTPQGTVLAWGENGDGQCDVPPGLGGVMAIAGGGYHSLALKSDGTLAGWGANYYGQLNAPPGLAHVVAIAAGSWHSLALRANGTVVAWGDNSWGQASVPPGLAGVVAIAAGGNHNLALRADGSVVAWGENTDAQGSYVGQSVVPWNLSGIRAIAAGEYHSLAVKADGAVVAWGDNVHAQAQPPTGLGDVVAVAGGGSHSVALRANGSVVAWGANWNGQCSVPGALTNITSIAAGSAHTLLLLGSPGQPPRITHQSLANGVFTAWLQTAAGKRYSLESRSSLDPGTWTTLSTVFGNGAIQSLVDSQASAPRRFYRVREW
jgi:M6 family metalloprotease-like protein